MGNHLDSVHKNSETDQGRAIFFYWIETTDLEKTERTWMNIHIENHGALPALNGAYSPVRT
jgi:hypothetical protein